MTLQNKRDEFVRHVWDHAADAFQAQFDDRRALTDEETRLLESVHEAISLPEDDEAVVALRRSLSSTSNALRLVLQLCGLTRNKILGDLRASSEARERGIRLPASFEGLIKIGSWQIAGPYLLSRLRSVLGPVPTTSITQDHVFEALNQATWPGYIRQERAKRSGHEAEYRLATLFASLEIPFEPFEKADNPLCRDAQINGLSFDVVVPSTKAPKVVVKSTVHTANIGQFGESKDHLEIREARQWIDQTYDGAERPTLLAFIDGIGFRSNSDGLNGVLTNADEFCQFKTLWKAAVIGASRMGISLDVAFQPAEFEEFRPFLERWGAMVDDERGQEPGLGEGGRPFEPANSGLTVHKAADIGTAIGWLEVGNALIRRRES